MRLSRRIVCICAVVLVLVTVSSCLVLSGLMRASAVSEAVSTVETRQRIIVSGFEQMTSDSMPSTKPGPVRNSLLRYSFSRVCVRMGALVVNGETLYSQLDFDPTSVIVPTDRDQVSRELTMNGEPIVLVASRISLAGANCDLYLCGSLAGTYQRIAQLTGLCWLVSTVTIGVGVGIISFLVRRALKPLDALNDSAKRIASGHCDEQIPIDRADEIGDLSASFNAMARAVQARVDELTAQAQKERFLLGAVTHEMRTPLAAMQMHADLLINANLDAEARSRCAQHICTQVRGLTNLSAGILQLLTAQEHVERQTVRTRDLADAVKESLDAVLTKRRTPLVVESCEGALNVNPDLMRSAVSNLVDNASKASAPDTAIRLEIQGTSIRVIDHGCGIAPEELSRITDPFYVVDGSRSKRAGGNGLGLALVQEICRLHDAQLRFESEPGRGTVAEIFFPENDS